MTGTMQGMTNAVRPAKGRYSEVEVERGLQVLAVMAGNTRRAQRELKARGFDVPRTALESWTAIHSDRYADIRERVVPEIQARIAQESESLAERYGELERKAIDRMEASMGDLKPAEAAGAARNLATSRAISIDKAQLLRNRPTEIVKHDVQADIRALLATGVAEVASAE